MFGARRWTAALLLGAVSLGGACKEEEAPPVMESEESTGEPPPAIGFSPSNIVLEPNYDVGDVTISRDCTLSSSGSSFCDAAASDFVFFEHTASDGSTLAVFVVENLTINIDTELEITGDNPVVLVAQSEIVNEGRIYVAPGGNGGFGTSAGEIVGLGPGAGTGIDGPVNGGGGGGFCGRGGNHGDGGGAGPTYGTAELVPLMGGSSGGERNSGSGGGALQLVAGVSIDIGQTVTVPGAGGEDGGGGAGGSLLLEAPTIVLTGRVATNGGGGASGDKSDGVEGRDRADPAAGGQGNGQTPGGDGSAADTAEGFDGASTVMTDQEFGSGGGGAGWIRFNTESGTADISGAVSPSFASGCASQGTLG